MLATITASSGRKPTQLRPLAISHDMAMGHVGRRSSSASNMSSTSTLPSPSVVAARAYFLAQSSPIGENLNALQRRRSLIEGQDFPRRHSALPTPGNLAAKIAKFTIPSQNAGVMQETTDIASNIKLQEEKDRLLNAIKQNDLMKVTAVATAARIDVNHASAGSPQEVPFDYIHDRLRDWGFTYLGNEATADAFINAVNLRRPSLQLFKEQIAGDRPKGSGMVTIRARVLPKAKERNPFLIQRNLDIDNLRASMPATQRPLKIPLRRFRRARRSSVQLSSTSLQRRIPERYEETISLLGKGAVPIHIEYAIHFLPVLAALLLSGHVRKGDSIDLPVPHPENWREMIYYIYTGDGDISIGAKENILFLAGDAG